MESKQKDNKNVNSNRKHYYILAMIAIIISIFLFFQTQIESKITNHPDVVLSKERIQKVDERLANIEREVARLKQIEWKLDQLLKENYP